MEYRPDYEHPGYNQVQVTNSEKLTVGTSGGIWGLEGGYCLMIGGPPATVARLTPIFRDLAPGEGSLPPAGSVSAGSTASSGYLHCGPAGAGHFVKMVHNGIEYGIMAAYAEGFNLFRHAGVGRDSAAGTDNAELYQYDFDLPAIAELWRRGSVVSSWLLDLTAAALAGDRSWAASRVACPTPERAAGL